MLDRLGTGGGTGGAVRAGTMGVPVVVVVITGCALAIAFGLGGMYGVSVSSSVAVFGTGDAWLAESTGMSRCGTETAAAASGRRAGTGGLAELPVRETPTAASGLGAGTGTCVFPAGILAESFPAAASGLGAGIGAETAG